MNLHAPKVMSCTKKLGFIAVVQFAQVKLVNKNDPYHIADCIDLIRVVAQTSHGKSASQSPERGANPQLVLQTGEGYHYSELPGRKESGKETVFELSTSQFSPTLPKCLVKQEIKSVSLRSPVRGNDGWHVVSIETYVKSTNKPYAQITSDQTLNRWVDYDQDEDRLVHLSSVVPTAQAPIVDTPECGYGNPVCTCSATAQHCKINRLEIDEIRTFTSYKKFPDKYGDGIFVRGVQGVVYEINDDGELEYLEQHGTKDCAKDFDRTNCSDPQFVDGKTYRMAIGVNGQIPGPTIIVHEDQMLTIHVHNNLTSEGISIHWHGMHQMDTPWMDGVGQITQCQIGPSSSFAYIYKASPSGTFWYHSHSGAQRTDGLFGALIVKEKTKKVLPNIAFEDHPDKHTISLLDWQHEASLDLFSQLNAGLGFYPGVPIGELPPNREGSRYQSEFSFDGAAVSPVPYFSRLINGKGRHPDVPYVKTRLSTFPVVKDKNYRFRLIGAQGTYAYKFSIDGHKLRVVSTDGYWTNPTVPADYIIIHTGERYDFILTADAEVKNYWIRAETLEIDRSSNDGVPPFNHWVTSQKESYNTRLVISTILLKYRPQIINASKQILHLENVFQMIDAWPLTVLFKNFILLTTQTASMSIN